jgi:hypothetical protein
MNQPTLIANQVRGDATSLLLPAHADALRDAGVDFLTAAFRAYGSLPADNSVVRITHFEPCLAGSTGQKMFLSVEYSHPQPDLPNELFVKFSRDFNDTFRDRRRDELEPEIRLCELSRLPTFPISVPVPHFGDFHRASGTGLLITKRINFGHDGIEPLRPKCMDHELDDPLEYYRAILSSLARLAAAHKSGALSPQVDALFPFDLATAISDDPIPWSEDELRELIRRYAIFASSYPQLMPAHLTTPEFVAQLERDAIAFLQHDRTIKRFLHGNTDFIALSHFNPNIDNAWFWRDSGGLLKCGLFDWQRARQMNVAYALWGGLCAASLDIWNHHLDELLLHFTTELHSHGGPQLDIEDLRLYLDMYAATMGLAGLIKTPALIFTYLPEAASATGPLDPVFHRSEAARSFLHIFTTLLNQWQQRNFGARLGNVLARMTQAANADLK